MSDVCNTWTTTGSSASFTDLTQAFLATQNLNLSTDIGSFSLNQEALKVLVNNIEAIRAEQLG